MTPEFLQESLFHCFNGKKTLIFSHPDYNCRFWILTKSAFRLVDLKQLLAYHHRSGISPCPEDNSLSFYSIDNILSRFIVLINS